MGKISILADLKPALDGFAGIPLETRYLFRGLRSLDSNKFNIAGLLQHDTEIIDAPPPSFSPSDSLESAFQTAQSIVSFFPPPQTGFISRTRRRLERFLYLTRLRHQALRERALPLNTFPAESHTHFIWSNLFASSMHTKDRDHLSAPPYFSLSVPKGLMHICGFQGLTYFHKPRHLSVDTSNFDFFIAQTPYPGRVAPNTKLVVRYHDTVPLRMPHVIGAKHHHLVAHYHALKQNSGDGADFVCVSESTADDLRSILTKNCEQVHVIPNMISDEYHPQPVEENVLHAIIKSRTSEESRSLILNEETERLVGPAQNLSYFLMVSTIEPRKNHATVIRAFEKLKTGSALSEKLILVGRFGWDSDDIKKIMAPLIHNGEIILLEDVPSSELRQLYCKAQATICPSFFEGFDYSAVEAMACRSPVIASDINVHKEILADAAIYFEPYSSDALAEIMLRLSTNADQLSPLDIVEKGEQRSHAFRPERIMPLWQSYFENRTNKKDVKNN